MIVSRQFPSTESEGIRQLLRSREVELFTGVKNDTLFNQQNKWVKVQVIGRGWVERRNYFTFKVTIEIILPELITDEA